MSRFATQIGFCFVYYIYLKLNDTITNIVGFVLFILNITTLYCIFDIVYNWRKFPKTHKERINFLSKN